MINDSSITRKDILRLIRKRELQFAGNSKLKIYGLLKCGSGKRMKVNNRVFFSSEQEAVNNGFRPCGHCMNVQYKQWKQTLH